MMIQKVSLFVSISEALKRKIQKGLIYPSASVSYSKNLEKM